MVTLIPEIAFKIMIFWDFPNRFGCFYEEIAVYAQRLSGGIDAQNGRRRYTGKFFAGIEEKDRVRKNERTCGFYALLRGV